ncbi:hypothetical protein BJF89_16010 [Corynebacterium sp. CNJ-954]|uniref:hypothetical protein n=1 Tax=Corynebacterium sp. CNJ-954 TaxID=1904962 RepID=UPI00096461EF|nr:hypothetical protein [Corynebacterium sp. CNJ-954]OLT55258.1 hypothetical protein BJF89_16010 [Corynebacterium sp. CNJ-954]
MTTRITPEQLARIKRESLEETRRIIREKYPDIDETRAARKRKNEAHTRSARSTADQQQDAT